MRTKNETVYCYSETERDAAMKRLKGPEVTRFKGLGEISPKEFKQFMSDDMRLTPVQIPSMGGVHTHAGVPHGQEHAGAEEVHRQQPRVDVLEGA